MEVSNHGKTAISTHSPRVGRDECETLVEVAEGLFQPTLPVWGETPKA